MTARRLFGLATVVAVAGIAMMITGCWPPGTGGKKAGKKGSCAPACKSCVEVRIDEDCRPEDASGTYLDTVDVKRGECLCFTNESDGWVKVEFHVLPNRRPVKDRGRTLASGERWCPKIKKTATDGEYYYTVDCQGGGSDGPKVKVGGEG